jgi:tetratricopeptide (TPR) repeat protein
MRPPSSSGRSNSIPRCSIGFRGYEDARSAFSKALELQPKSFDATVGLGVAYRGLEQKDKAEEFYNKAKELDPNRAEPYYNLGLLYQDFKDSSVDQVKKARSYYEQFLSKAGGQDRYKHVVDDIKRRCKTIKGQRRPNDKCISGRFQNIEDYLRALKDMEEMERLQKESERQQAELEAQQKKEEAQNKGASPPAGQGAAGAASPAPQAAEPAAPTPTPAPGPKPKP